MLYRCYAKVNLTLEILGKREDGYHELASLVHTISLSDILRVEPADHLSSRVEGLDIDPDANLVARAAELFRASLDAKRGAELSLVKHVPAAAGLGGGSSDAAATLVGLNALWGTRSSSTTLSRLAAELGSDVPFFLRGGAALMRGRGERLQMLTPRIGQWLVLLVPTHSVPDKTRRLYAELAPTDFTAGEMTSRDASRLEHGEPLAECEFVNGFERAARSVFVGLNETWQQAQEISQRRFFLSGAGPALFALASNSADAREQVGNLEPIDAAVYAVRTVKQARSPLRFAPAGGIGYA
jgi:4-diphosphocytidyl-2-C-methyl-D-erythritol kinase